MQMPRQVAVRINAALASTNVLNTHTHHAHHIYAHVQVQGGLPQPACVSPKRAAGGETAGDGLYSLP